DSLCCDLFHTDDLDFRGRRTIDFQQYWTNVLTPDKGQELLGYELQRVNVGTITRGEVGGIQASTLLLDETGREVRVGDRLIPVDAQPYDLQFFPHAPAQQLEYGRARVLAVADTLSHGGPRDVIVLSVGRAKAWTTAPCSRSGARARTPSTASRRARTATRTPSSTRTRCACPTSSPATRWCSAPTTRSATRWSWTASSRPASATTPSTRTRRTERGPRTARGFPTVTASGASGRRWRLRAMLAA